MSFPLWDLAQDLAVARGGGAVKTDPMELIEPRTLRRRIEALAWIPSAGGMLALAAWMHRLDCGRGLHPTSGCSLGVRRAPGGIAPADPESKMTLPLTDRDKERGIDT